MIILILAAALLFQDRQVAFEEGRAIEVRPAWPRRPPLPRAVSFPEESIESMVAAWNEADLSVEQKRNLLFLKSSGPRPRSSCARGQRNPVPVVPSGPGSDSQSASSGRLPGPPRRRPL